MSNGEKQLLTVSLLLLLLLRSGQLSSMCSQCSYDVEQPLQGVLIVVPGVCYTQEYVYILDQSRENKSLVGVIKH